MHIYIHTSIYIFRLHVHSKYRPQCHCMEELGGERNDALS